MYKNVKRLSVKPESNIVKFLKYFMKYFRVKKFHEILHHYYWYSKYTPCVFFILQHILVMDTWSCSTRGTVCIMALRSKLSRLFLLTNLVVLGINISLMLFNFDTHPLLDFITAEAITAADRRLMLSTFSTLVNALDKANVTYFMYGGTLIGSIRHHGPIPWDDDLDVIMAYGDRSKAKAALSALSPDFKLYKPAESQTSILQWKFYSASAVARSLLPKPYRWPFVDIFFFNNNSTHIWDVEPEYLAASFVWPKSIIFPLTKRPFGSILAPSPCNSIEFVTNNYPGADMAFCATPSFNHRLDIHRLPWRAGNIIPCTNLWNVFPFVFRNQTVDGRMTESLRIGNWTLQTLHMPRVVCKGNSLLEESWLHTYLSLAYYAIAVLSCMIP